MSEKAPPITVSQGYNIRLIKDRLMSWFMGFGGISVIIAIVLILFYLLYVVFPLFIPAHMERASQYTMPSATAGNTLHLAMEEQNELGARFTDQGIVTFFNIQDGTPVKSERLIDSDHKVTSFAHGKLAKGFFAIGLDNGTAVIARHTYRLVYGEDKRTIVPEIIYPLGEDPVLLDEDTQLPLQQLALRLDEERATIATSTANNNVIISRLIFDEELGDEPVEFEKMSVTLPNIQNITGLFINTDQRLLYIVHSTDEITLVDIDDIEEPQVLERTRVVSDEAKVTSISLLTGEISLLIGDDHGSISQWFPVNTEEGLQLSKIREFKTQQSAVTQIITEQRRKGFAAVDNKGQLGIYHSTARRTLLHEKAGEYPVTHLAVSPRANVVLMEDNHGNYQRWNVENEHPEVSWQVLWEQVWYESYQQPEYIWQSSSSSNDFEPKFSLMPLAFGTIKAAFYAMLFAVPLAIMGAIYTAYFMSPTMRAYVKPTIEIMEALPTVILGFLAGLWLAPTIESHLPGVFALLVLMPLGVLTFAYGWQKLPEKIRQSIPDGWHAALLIPVL
ncbi:MAG: phosphate ABC transporter permease [Gammaproteobacteria bacterium]